MMPLACWLTTLAPAALSNVTLPATNTPVPPTPRAITEPVLVMTPGTGSSETMPCASKPETSIVPWLVSVLLPVPLTSLPFANMPYEPAPVVVMEPLLMSVSLTVNAAMPCELSPLVTGVPLLVRVPRRGS